MNWFKVNFEVDNNTIYIPTITYYIKASSLDDAIKRFNAWYETNGKGSYKLINIGPVDINIID